MTTRNRRSLLAVTAAAGALAAAPAGASAAETVFAVTADEELTSFSSDAPGRTAPLTKISGLQSGEDVEGIDVRPETGALYALGSSGRLYTIDVASGRATVASTLSTALSGSDFGVDFNPTVDRLRIVSDTGQNLRVNVDTGAATVDGTLNPAGAKATAAGYENSFPDATTTRLLDVDSGSDRLRVQAPPNDGRLTDVGALGIDASGDVAMDIAPSDNVAYAAIRREGQSNASTFYTLDSATGAATAVGDLGAGRTITGIAIARQSVTVYGVTGTTPTLVSFASTDAGNVRTIGAITGLQAGEDVEGIDARPATGVIYALGSTGRLYTINRTTGAATQVGTNVVTLDGNAFGFDFNPTVDRIRLTSDTGQDLRLNPNDATIAATDPALNPAGVEITASAYTNSFAGSTATTLFNIDQSSDRLTRQDPPNAGTQVAVGPLGVSPSSGDTAFDIQPQDNAALAVLTVGATTGLYRPLLTTGAARPSGALGLTAFPVAAAAVGDAGSLGLTASSYSAGESAGTANLTLVRENGDGWAAGTYAAPDGASATGAVTFAPGERLKDIRVPVTDDSVDGPDRTFKLTLARGSGGYRLGQSEATVTVVDDDPAPAATPAPAPVAVPDTAKPIALVIGQDRKLATVRSKGVNVLYSVNEAATITMTFKLGTTTVGTATTRRTSAGIGRLNVKLTTAGKKAVGSTKTRRLVIEARVSDASGNAATSRSSFLAKR